MARANNVLQIVLMILNLLLSVICECYPGPSYKAIEKKHSCKLYQPNWAAETYFQITYKRCKEKPKFDVLIRNFYGIDEINMEFSEVETTCSTRKFNGQESAVSLEISIFEANPKYNYKSHVQAKVIVGSETVLAAVFLKDDKLDCAWMEKLSFDHQLLFGTSLFLGFIVVGIIVYCCIKAGKRRRCEKEEQSFQLVTWQTAF